MTMASHSQQVITQTNNAIESQSSDLLEFLSITTPADLHPSLASATPLLCRCIQRLGLFPWHQKNTNERQGISLDELMVAVIILRRHEINVGSIAFRLSYIAATGDKQVAHQNQWFNELLFQCMAIKTVAGATTTSEDSQASRQFANDFHLSQAYRLVTDNNKVRDLKRLARGPDIIAMADLPTSNSLDFSGTIPQDEFKALVRILLASQLQVFGYGPGLVAANMDELDEVADAVSKAFAGESKSYVSWDAYRTTMAMTTVRVQPRLSDAAMDVSWLTYVSQTCYQLYAGH
jgi:hypothetical protein